MNTFTWFNVIDCIDEFGYFEYNKNKSRRYNVFIYRMFSSWWLESFKYKDWSAVSITQ